VVEHGPAEHGPVESLIGFFDGPLPRIFAHRGWAADAPENTLRAFAAALALGITHFETDVHASVDGVPVVSHDADLARTAGIAGRIDQLPFAELQKIDLGRGQSYPSLQEALCAFPEARFNIDLKSDGAVMPAVEAIRGAQATHRVLLTSFDNARRLRAVRLLPGVATSASALPFAIALLAVTLGITPLARHVLRGMQAVQVPERFRGLRVVSARSVRLLKKCGVEVHVWTINDPAAMTRLLDLGVDALITDRPDLALEIIRVRLASRE
jgi:glycerophosphoryl diester phosphodiesterase